MADSNYYKAKLKAEKLFAEMQHDAVIEKFKLRTDDEFIYVRIFCCDYKINKKTGRVLAAEEGSEALREADFDESLTVFDLLDEGHGLSFPKGSYCRLNSLHGISKYSSPMDGKLYGRLLDSIKDDPGILKRVCEKLGGVPCGKADIAYRLPLFKELCFCIYFWDADDEFPMQLYFMWDENMLSYLKFETIWYLAAMLQNQLADKISAEKSGT